MKNSKCSDNDGDGSSRRDSDIKRSKAHDKDPHYVKSDRIIKYDQHGQPEKFIKTSATSGRVQAVANAKYEYDGKPNSLAQEVRTDGRGRSETTKNAIGPYISSTPTTGSSEKDGLKTYPTAPKTGLSSTTYGSSFSGNIGFKGCNKPAQVDSVRSSDISKNGKTGMRLAAKTNMQRMPNEEKKSGRAVISMEEKRQTQLREIRAEKKRQKQRMRKRQAQLREIRAEKRQAQLKADNRAEEKRQAQLMADNRVEAQLGVNGAEAQLMADNRVETQLGVNGADGKRGGAGAQQKSGGEKRSGTSQMHKEKCEKDSKLMTSETSENDSKRNTSQKHKEACENDEVEKKYRGTSNAWNPNSSGETTNNPFRKNEKPATKTTIEMIDDFLKELNMTIDDDNEEQGRMKPTSQSQEGQAGWNLLLDEAKANQTGSGQGTSHRADGTTLTTGGHNDNNDKDYKDHETNETDPSKNNRTKKTNPWTKRDQEARDHRSHDPGHRQTESAPDQADVVNKAGAQNHIQKAETLPRCQASADKTEPSRRSKTLDFPAVVQREMNKDGGPVSRLEVEMLEIGVDVKIPPVTGAPAVNLAPTSSMFGSQTPSPKTMTKNKAAQESRTIGGTNPSSIAQELHVMAMDEFTNNPRIGRGRQHRKKRKGKSPNHGEYHFRSPSERSSDSRHRSREMSLLLEDLNMNEIEVPRVNTPRAPPRYETRAVTANQQ